MNTNEKLSNWLAKCVIGNCALQKEEGKGEDKSPRNSGKAELDQVKGGRNLTKETRKDKQCTKSAPNYYEPERFD